MSAAVSAAGRDPTQRTCFLQVPHNTNLNHGRCCRSQGAAWRDPASGCPKTDGKKLAPSTRAPAGALMKCCCPPCAVYFHEGPGVPRDPAWRVVFLDERSGSPASTRVERRPRDTASTRDEDCYRVNHPARAGASPPVALGGCTRCYAGSPRAPAGRWPSRPRRPTAWTDPDPSRRAARGFPRCSPRLIFFAIVSNN